MGKGCFWLDTQELLKKYKEDTLVSDMKYVGRTSVLTTFKVANHAQTTQITQTEGTNHAVG